MNTWSKPHRGDRTWPGTWSFSKIHMDGKGIWQSHFRRKNRVREETDGVNLAWEETMRQPPEWDSGPHHSLQPQFWTVHLQWLCSLLFQPDVPVSFHGQGKRPTTPLIPAGSTSSGEGSGQGSAGFPVETESRGCRFAATLKGWNWKMYWRRKRSRFGMRFLNGISALAPATTCWEILGKSE